MRREASTQGGDCWPEEGSLIERRYAGNEHECIIVNVARESMQHDSRRRTGPWRTLVPRADIYPR